MRVGLRSRRSATDQVRRYVRARQGGVNCFPCFFFCRYSVYLRASSDIRLAAGGGNNNAAGRHSVDKDAAREMKLRLMVKAGAFFNENLSERMHIEPRS